MDNNLEIYQRTAEVPAEAQKEITAGKLKGKTDINPMWRIKTLTELFGPCGIGWYTKILERWVERDANESSAWVRIEMFVKFPGTNEWSAPIEGIGGSKQCGKGQGDGINDEAFKMAETDAISVACKKLGFGANIYWAKDRTKYSQVEEPQTAKKSATAAPVKKADAEPDTKALEDLALADALRDVDEAKNAKELTEAWDRWKQAFGSNEKLRRAIAMSPVNPKNGRSNG
jgi:hypothetical protein|nr:MAG TPA_asm: DNA repair protein-like protein [Caudoviricetes sp.]